jgi:hypothetical protein
MSQRILLLSSAGVPACPSTMSRTVSDPGSGCHGGAPSPVLTTSARPHRDHTRTAFSNLYGKDGIGEMRLDDERALGGADEVRALRLPGLTQATRGRPLTTPAAPLRAASRASRRRGRPAEAPRRTWPLGAAAAVLASASRRSSPSGAEG